jgi:S1-C subfamily serine protease
MKRPLTTIVVALVWASGWLSSPPCRGQADPAIVELGKKATALVEVRVEGGIGYGSAFCIDKSGIFVTNAHVVQDAVQDGSVKLVLKPSEPKQRIVRAKVLRSNDELDLAVLKIDPDASFAPVDLGKDEDISETMPVWVFGFPFGKALAAQPGQYPSVSVNPSHVTARRTADGKLALVQLDGDLNPGNSGGPVLDAKGRVIGLVRSGLLGAGINFAIAVGRLREYLDSPILTLDIPRVDYARRGDAAEWTIKVAPATKDSKLPPDLTVSVTLDEGTAAPRKTAARPVGGGVYKAKVVPVTRDPGRKVLLSVSIYGQFVQGIAPDLPLKINGKSGLLSDLRILTSGNPPTAILQSGKSISAPIFGLGRVRLETKNGLIRMDLEQATQIQVLGVSKKPVVEALTATFELKQGQKVLASESKLIKLDGAVAVVVKEERRAPTIGVPVNNALDDLVIVGGTLNAQPGLQGAGKAIRPAPDTIPEASYSSGPARFDGEGSPLERVLPGKIFEVATAGAGRYLLLQLRDVRKLAVFDANVADVVKLLPLPSDQVLVAGGAEKFVLLFPDEKLIQRWDLASLSREESKQIPIRGKVVAAAMGSDSKGPVLVSWGTESGTINNRAFSLIDVGSLKALQPRQFVQGQQNWNGNTAHPSPALVLNPFGHGSQPPEIRASAEGRAFGIWNPSVSPTGFQTLALYGGTVESFYDHRGSGSLVPGQDSSTIYTATDGIRDLRAKALPSPSDEAKKWMFLPSADPAYYFGVSSGMDNVRQPAARPAAVVVYPTGSALPLVSIEKLDEMNNLPADSFRPDSKLLPRDRRFHWVPAANLLITVPASNDKIVVRRFDLEKALERVGGDFLYVASPRAISVSAGEKLVHKIEVRSRKGGIKCTLSHGPPGMTVSPDGLVEWRVPVRSGQPERDAVITIEDGTGQQLFHSLTLGLR